VKRNWFKRQDRFAGFVHWSNVLFELRRRDRGAQMTVGIHEYRRAVGNSCAENAHDIGGGLCSLGSDANCIRFGRNTDIADVDVIIARGEVGTSLKAQCCIGAAGVAAAGRVVQQRKNTGGRVGVAGGVAVERTDTGGCIRLAACVVVERLTASGGVVVAVGIAVERLKTDRRIVIPANIA
jgi:hypothetical protein